VATTLITTEATTYFSSEATTNFASGEIAGSSSDPTTAIKTVATTEAI